MHWAKLDMCVNGSDRVSLNKTWGMLGTDVVLTKQLCIYQLLFEVDCHKGKSTRPFKSLVFYTPDKIPTYKYMQYVVGLSE